MTSNNVLKIGDFGLAKVQSTLSNKAKTMLGTPYYISP